MSDKNTLTHVEIFTDGACSGNPGPGGYGVVLRAGDHTKELSGGESATTNNRMENLAFVLCFCTQIFAHLAVKWYNVFEKC